MRTSLKYCDIAWIGRLRADERASRRATYSNDVLLAVDVQRGDNKAIHETVVVNFGRAVKALEAL